MKSVLNAITGFFKMFGKIIAWVYRKVEKYPKVSIAMAVVILMSVTTTSYVLLNFQSSANGFADRRSEKLIEEVGKIVELPAEQPSVAYVTDKSQLSDKPIFEKAENGDALLFFAGEQKVILYRPRTKKVIDVAPLVLRNSSGEIPTFQPAQPEQQSSPVETTQLQQLRLAILNGTGSDEGILKASEIVAQHPELVVAFNNTTEEVVETTMCVTRSEIGKNATSQLESIFSCQVGELPETEIDTQVDAIVVIGTDIL